MSVVRRPRWRLLFALVPLTIGLFFVEDFPAVPVEAHPVIEFAILLFVFGCMALWLRGNRTGMSRAEVSKLTEAGLWHTPPTPYYRIVLVKQAGRSTPDHALVASKPKREHEPAAEPQLSR